MRDVVKCPFCLEWVRAVEMPTDARVECPLCGAQVAAEALLQLELPQLRVVTASAVEEPAAQPAPGFWDDEPAEIQQRSEDRGPSESESPAPLRQVLEVFEPVETLEGARVPSPFVGAPQVGSPSVARSWKSRRRGQRPWLELAKIVLGGLAGIVIAQLILWWLPGTLRRDPLGLAPRLPSWLQWLCPADFAAARPARVRTARASAASQVRHNPFADESADADAPSADRPHVVNRPEITAVPAATMSDHSASAAHNAAALQQQLRLAPVYSGEELQQALAQALTALEELEAASDPSAHAARRERQRALYQRLCEVAQTVAFVDVNDPQIGRRMKAVEALTERIARSPELRRLVAEAAGSWLNYSARTSNGIALIGEVTEIRAVDKMFETELQVDSKASPHVLVLSTTQPQYDPRAPYDVGQQLILLGSILSEPAPAAAATLAQPPSRIWNGFHAVCSP